MEDETLAPSPFTDESEEPILDDINDEEIVDEDNQEPDDKPEDDELGEERVESDEGELSDEEIDDLLDELEDDTDEEPADVVPHAALHKERERRKAMQIDLNEQQTIAQEANDSVEKYRSTLSDVKRQLKELGLDDTIEIDEPESVSPEVLEMRREKTAIKQQEQVTTLVTDLREEAAAHLSEFPQIDGADSEQAELILGFAMASTMLGADKEDSVLKAMTILNKHLGSAKKAVRRKPAPARRAAPTGRSGNKRTQTRSAIKKGDVRGVFKNYASDMLD